MCRKCAQLFVFVFNWHARSIICVYVYPGCTAITLHLRVGRNKLKGATAMLSMFSGKGVGGSSAEEDAEFEEDKDRLRDFQFKMLELQVR